MPIAGAFYDYDEVRKKFEMRSALTNPSLRSLVLSRLAEATLAKRLTSAGISIHLKRDEGETGPHLQDELVGQIRRMGLPSHQIIRLGSKTVWRRMSEFFPNQFPSAPRLSSKAE